MQVEEVKRLQRKPLLEILGHAPKADAPHLFKPCSTQRLYLHEHPDFNDISEVNTCLFPMSPLRVSVQVYYMCLLRFVYLCVGFVAGCRHSLA